MKGMIFAAGLGSRLRPITDTIPKPLIEIDGKPILEHVVLKMKEAGISEIVINIHHLADKIKKFIEDNESFGVRITLSEESDKLLDTGGGLLNCSGFLMDNGPIVLYNSDIYSDFPLVEMIDFHQKSGGEVTLLTDDRKTSRRFLFDENGRMRGWIKGEGDEVKPKGLDFRKYRPLAFGGVHIIEPEVLCHLKEYSRIHGEVFSITPFYIDLCGKISINQFSPKSAYSWYDIGKPEVLKILAGQKKYDQRLS